MDGVSQKIGEFLQLTMNMGELSKTNIQAKSKSCEHK